MHGYDARRSYHLVAAPLDSYELAQRAATDDSMVEQLPEEETNLHMTTRTLLVV